jgi:hypothetical protein
MSIAVSSFDDYTDAQRAVDRLVHAGFRRMDLHIEVGSAALSDTASASEPPRHEHDRGVLASIGYAFVSLFGQDNPPREVHAYADAVRSGHSVVMVYVDNDEEAGRATQVMQERSAAPAGPWRASGGRAAGHHAGAG